MQDSNDFLSSLSKGPEPTDSDQSNEASELPQEDSVNSQNEEDDVQEISRPTPPPQPQVPPPPPKKKASRAISQYSTRIVSYGKLRNFSIPVLKYRKLGSKSQEKCTLCRCPADPQLGCLLQVDKQNDVNIHDVCGYWSSGVVFNETEAKFQKNQVYNAMMQSQFKICQICQQNYATLDCHFKDCPRSFHFNCFMNSNERIGQIHDRKQKQVACEAHIKPSLNNSKQEPDTKISEPRKKQIQQIEKLD